MNDGGWIIIKLYRSQRGVGAKAVFKLYKKSLRIVEEVVSKFNFSPFENLFVFICISIFQNLCIPIKELFQCVLCILKLSNKILHSCIRKENRFKTPFLMDPSIGAYHRVLRVHLASIAMAVGLSDHPSTQEPNQIIRNRCRPAASGSIVGESFKPIQQLFLGQCKSIQEKQFLDGKHFSPFF